MFPQVADLTSKVRPRKGSAEPLADSPQPPRLGGRLGRGWGMECAYFIQCRVSQGREAFLLTQPGRAPCSLPTPQYSQYSHSHDLTAMSKPGRQPAARDPPKSTSPRDHHKSVMARTCCSNNLHPPRCTCTRQRVPLCVYSSQAGPPPLPRRLHQAVSPRLPDPSQLLLPLQNSAQLSQHGKILPV